MYINVVRIWNFKRFDYIEVPLTDGLNVLVGDNDSGKSTVLEAVHLVLTGVYRGRAISGAISEDLFNREIVRSFFQSARGGGGDPAPYVRVEVVFGGREAETAQFLGDGNLKRQAEPGIFLSIELDEEEFGNDFRQYVNDEESDELPVEYYRCVRGTFARERLVQNRLKFRSSLIDSSGFFLRPGSRAYVSKTARDALPEANRIGLVQAYRRAQTGFNVDEQVVLANKEIAKKVRSLSKKKVSFAASRGNKDAWEGGVETRLDNIPLENAGAGSRSIVGIEIALTGGEETTGIVLVEEPEAHLSHTAMSELLSALPSRTGGRQLLVSTHSSFVANKLDLSNIVCLSELGASRPFEKLEKEDALFFSKLAGYDTLRLLFCRAAILVEGDSDELVVQRAYMNGHAGHLSIQEGVEVISVGTSFLRFLRLGEMVGRTVVAVTDNDGDLEAVREKYDGYTLLSEEGKQTEKSHSGNVAVSFPGRLLKTGSIEKYSYNTLEPELFEANELSGINRILEREFETRDEALRYMKNNKTDCALKIFTCPENVAIPEYIQRALIFVAGTSEAVDGQ